MTRIKIVTDSSVRIEPSLIEELGITVVPLSVMIDGVIYADTDLAEGQFLQLMREAANLPKTSQPPVGLFAETYTRLSADGSQILSIHLSHGLSGTIEAARQGAQLAQAQVSVIDSGFTDQATKFQVVAAARLALEGHDVAAIEAALAVIRDKTELFIGVSTLENLVKGGRVGRVTGLLSSLLNIRVIMEMRDHELCPVVKGRGNKTFKKWLDEWIASLADRPVAEIAISYAGSPALAEEFKAVLQPFVTTDIVVLETSSTIQTHTGEDAWAILVRYE